SRLQRYPPPLTLHPFPTRRSSDLETLPGLLMAMRWQALSGQGARHGPAPGGGGTGVGGEVVMEFYDMLDQIVHLLRSRGRVSYRDRKSTRLNSSHQIISYAVFCLK